MNRRDLQTGETWNAQWRSPLARSPKANGTLRPRSGQGGEGVRVGGARLVPFLVLGLSVVLTVFAASLVRAQDQTPAGASPAATDETSRAGARFTSVDIFIDSGTQPLAAYQFEFKPEAADVKIVGIEGGEHPAFRIPPYYDPAALAKGRVIIAAFNTGKNLPSGRTRVATLHLRVAGSAQPRYGVSLTVAASPEGKAIAAEAEAEAR